MRKTEPLNVLVLGVGGNVGQGILKALARASLNCRVVGACTNAGAPGLYTTDDAYISPAAKDDNFYPWLLDVCRRQRIHVVLSGVEPVLAKLATLRNSLRAECGAICLNSAPVATAVGADKLLTCIWLRDHGFNYPQFAAADDPIALAELVASVGFPLLAKPRCGKGGAGVMLVPDAATLERISSLPNYVVQEHLGDDDCEFTASTISDSADRVRGVIVLKRTLLHGTTVSATAGDFPAIRSYARNLTAALQPRGPCNIQLRLHRGQPVCFELNVRFSGTTPIRARFGFNDVEAALRHYVLNEPMTDLPVITSGCALRYWNEVYVPSDTIAEMAAKCGRSGGPVALGEDYGIRP